MSTVIIYTYNSFFLLQLTGSSLSSSLNLIFIGVLAIFAYKFIGRS
jgi:hypothetical protein